MGLLHLYLLTTLSALHMSVPLAVIMTKRFPVWELFRTLLSQGVWEEQGRMSSGEP
jgi:hypothetical protein